LADELNSDSPWIDEIVHYSFHGDSFPVLEGVATTLDVPPVPPTDHPLLSIDDDHFGPPSATSGGAERVNSVGFTLDACNMSYSTQPDDLYATFSLSLSLSTMMTDCTSSRSFDRAYQTTYTELFQNDNDPCVPVQAMSIYDPTQLVQYDQSVSNITQTLSDTHFPDAPVGPSTMTTYPPYFDHACDSSQAPSTPDNASVASLPPSSPPVSSSRCDSSESDGESDADYVPPSDDDDEYRPTQVAPPQKKEKQKKTRSPKSKSPRRQNSSPARSTSSESERSVSSSRASRRSHPYKRRNTSRNFQRYGGAILADRESDFLCPVVGCDYAQRNQRVPDLKRHAVTHDRWLEPDKWTCCGVAMDRAHLYDTGIEEGMTEDDFIQAGAYLFKGRLMIGGCLKTFARRDALKRHVDNPKIPCVGHMGSYY